MGLTPNQHVEATWTLHLYQFEKIKLLSQVSFQALPCTSRFFLSHLLQEGRVINNQYINIFYIFATLLYLNFFLVAMISSFYDLHVGDAGGPLIRRSSKMGHQAGQKEFQFAVHVEAGKMIT